MDTHRRNGCLVGSPVLEMVFWMKTELYYNVRSYKLQIRSGKESKRSGSRQESPFYSRKPKLLQDELSLEGREWSNVNTSLETMSTSTGWTGLVARLDIDRTSENGLGRAL